MSEPHELLPKTSTPAPAPAVLQQPAPPTPVARAKPQPEATTTSFVPDQFVGLLLQRCYERGVRALDEASPTRSGLIVLASEHISAYLEEVGEVGGTSNVDWARQADALTSVRSIVSRLDTQLEDARPIAKRLDAAMAKLVAVVPAENWLAQPAPPSRGTDLDRIALSRQAIRATVARLTPLPVLDPKQDVRSQAIAYCTPLQLPLAIAGDAARSVADRRARLTLKPEVEALSAAMDQLSELLGMRPRLAWDSTFAATFDAENSLRQDLGLTPRIRPYSGMIDPVAAVAEVNAVAHGKDVDVRDRRLTDPQSAVRAIDIGVRHVFDRQIDAVKDLEQKLKIRRPPPSRSIAETLLEIGTNVALATAAGVIGSAVARLFGRGLEKLSVGLYVKPASLKLLSEEARKEVTGDILEHSAFARAVVGDMVKDGAKEMFRSPMRMALATSARPLGVGLLEDFVHAHVEKLQVAQLHSALAMNSLWTALQQADLDTLNALAYTLLNEMDQASYETQYDHSMREWENLRAQLDAGPASVQMGKETPRDADVREDHVAGVLDVELTYSGRGDLALRSLRLYGAEPAAVTHFRRTAVPLGATGLNQRYQVHLVSRSHDDKLVFGVGPDRGLIVESLTHQEWALLRILAERDPITLDNVNRSLRGEYSTTSDAAALKVVRGIIQFASTVSTSRLED